MHALDVGATTFSAHVLQSPVPVLVDFYSTRCPPCRALAPHLDQLAVEFEGCAKIVNVNVDRDPVLAAQYGIAAVPTLIWFEGGREVDRTVGGNPSAIRQRLRALCLA